MKILYLGDNSGTSLHRARALGRLGHDVHIVDPKKYLPTSKLGRKLGYETGGLTCSHRVKSGVLKALEGLSFDLTWVDNGRYVNSQLIKTLQSRYGKVLNYNIDDPFSYRDRLSWTTYKLSVKAYDLLAVVRTENIPEAKAAGAKKVVRVFRAADEVAHRRRELSLEEKVQFGSKVVFVGTCMEKRAEFMATLIKAGVPLTLVGARWDKNTVADFIKPSWKANQTKTDDEYAFWSQGAEICLGLLSTGNRDLHTTRSLELPAMGCLFLAPRTPEHLELYNDGEEAVFWTTVEECADKCLSLLSDPSARQDIREAGYERNKKNGHFNEQVASRLLSEVSN